MTMHIKKFIVAGSLALGVFVLAGSGVAHAAGPLPVDLDSAGNFVILGKTAVTTTGATVIVGDVGISPADSSSISGFALNLPAASPYSTSALVTGRVYAPDYAVPTPAYLTGAVSAMEAAYVDAAGRASPDATNVAAGIIGGQTFTPGLYKWTTDVSIAASGATSTDVTLVGGATDVWIFQITGDLTLASGGSIPLGAKIVLSGGAVASNVFWQVGGLTGATLGTNATFNGNILSAKQIIMQSGAVLNGRALAQTQVTLIGNTVSLPAGAGPATLHVVKLVVNGSGGAAVPANFSVNVKNASGAHVSGSPLAGTAAPGSSYTLAAGTYTVSESVNSSYIRTFTGACNSGGAVTLTAGQDVTCTVVNTDIPLVASGGRIVPLIGLLKIPTPLALPGGSGQVTYNYTLWNVGGQQALTSVTITDNKCTPGPLLSGDLNSNGKLDPNERWSYSCTTTLSETTTNTAIATGYGDDTNSQAAIATALATVAVGASVPPPLINIIKVPNRLTPFPFGGGTVTYAYIVTNPGVVAMNEVRVTDDKCAPLIRTSGDVNGNNLLDPGESWAYTCQTNVAVSTRNIATAEGRANGFTALGYAFADVLVSTPGLPNTGAPSVPWKTVALSGALSGALLISYVIRKRQTA